MSIDNRSTDTIKIYFDGLTARTNGTDSVIALPNNETIYYSSDGWRIKSKNHNCDPQISPNEVTTISSSGKILTRDISDKLYWTCETDKKNTFWKMIFIIEQSDLK